ncbi:MAG TPA: sensor domain-containing diguanylate cyclase [bacterium]|nr:sensor domain-containing diguanylate cyclase [bacterium]
MKTAWKEFLTWFLVQFLGIVLFILITFKHLTFLRSFAGANHIPASSLMMLLSNFSLYLLLSYLIYLFTFQINGTVVVQILAFTLGITFLFLFPTPEKTWVYLLFLAALLASPFFLFLLEQREEKMSASFAAEKENYDLRKNALLNDIEEKETKNERLRALLKRYDLLHQVVKTVTGSLEADQLFYLILQNCHKLIPKGSAGLKSVSESLDPFDTWVLRNERPLISLGKEKNLILASSPAQLSFESVIEAPIFHHGKITHLLKIEDREEGAFEEEDLRLLTDLAGIASITLSNALYFQKIRELAVTDALTGLYVLKFFKERLDEEIKRASRFSQKVSLLLLDIDFFKKINDTYGHQAGDAVLEKLAETLRGCLRPADIVARYGGEEFAVLLICCSRPEALELGERIRQETEKSATLFKENPIRCTVSVGAASFPEDALNPEQLIRKADEALYRAKRAGRNRVVSA